jgi:phospholipase/carboxylesterase
MNTITTPLIYRAYPARTKTAETAPVLILLHGRGTDENDLAGLIPHMDARFEIYTIRAPFEFEYGGYTWFGLDDIEGSYNKAELNQGLNDLIDFVKQCGARRKIYLFGFSMGAMMAYAASLTHPELFAGVVAHSGLVPEQAHHLAIRWTELSKCGFCIAHGVYDPVLSIDYARRAKELFAQSNAEVFYKEYPMGHEISPESLSDTSSWLTTRLDA